VRDLLEHPLPLVVANVVWGALVTVAWLAAVVSPPLAVAVVVVLTWPAATVAGVAARLVRGDPVGVRDALRWPIRRGTVALLGAVAALAVVVGLVDLQGALTRGDLVGVAFATLAVWGLIALGVVASVTWPLVGDPARARHSTAALLRLAATIVFLRTPRVLAACLVVGVFLLISAVLAAAILTVSLSLAALVLAHVVLPMADVLEQPIE
jgi:hypothetical protein